MQSKCLFASGLIFGLVALSGCVSIQDITGKTAQPKKFLLKLKPDVKHQQCELHQQTSIKVNPPQVLTQFDQTSFVYRLDDQRYATDYYHQFFINVSDQFRQLMENNLMAACWRVFKPGVNYMQRPQYQLSSQVNAMYADYRDKDNPKAVLKLRYYLVNDDKQNVVFDKTYQQTQSLKQADSQSLLNAWNQESQHITQQLISDIQSYQS